jgi:hypothetical protein
VSCISGVLATVEMFISSDVYDSTVVLMCKHTDSGMAAGSGATANFPCLAASSAAAAMLKHILLA